MNPLTRPSIEDAQALIQSVTYTRLPHGTAIVCEIVVRPNHPVHGIACVADMENDNSQLGKKTAYAKALDKVFEYVSYELHKKMETQEAPNRNAELLAAYNQSTQGHPVLVGDQQAENQQTQHHPV